MNAASASARVANARAVCGYQMRCRHGCPRVVVEVGATMTATRVPEGTLMRHFLRLAFAPDALARGVSTRAAVAVLVALRGAAQRFAPAYPRTFTGAVAVAAVAVAADAHLLRAAPAIVQPIALLACLHAPARAHWTTPRIAGIKAERTRLSARACRRPGVLARTCPGLRLFGVRIQA